jgi:hypothetical protein
MCESMVIPHAEIVHKEYCNKYYNGLLNANFVSAYKGIITYYTNLLKLHDEYIQAYNDKFTKGKIGNGKTYKPEDQEGGFDYDIYPKSHPVLRDKNF